MLIHLYFLHQLDLAEELRSVPNELVEDWCIENGLDLNLHMETSSKTRENVEEAFLLALSAWRNRNTKDFDFSTSTIRLDFMSGCDFALMHKRKLIDSTNYCTCCC